MGAEISPCGKYRYRLWRIWDESKPFCLFVMHNPSTADAFMEDPTIRRCMGYAKAWGYGGIYVGNLSPYRATDPKDLKDLPFHELYPVDSMYYINEMIEICQMHILAYGNPMEKVLGYKPNWSQTGWHYLKLTKDGNPCHPLYLKKDLTPIKF